MEKYNFKTCFKTTGVVACEQTKYFYNLFFMALLRCDTHKKLHVINVYNLMSLNICTLIILSL